MISIALAWVYVTLIKYRKENDVAIDIRMFFLTGVIDFLLITISIMLLLRW